MAHGMEPPPPSQFPSLICILSLSSQGHECPPPPPVSWGHITGLQPSLLGHLKGFVKNLDKPLQKECSLAVIPTYLAYLHAYYHQLSKQVPDSVVYCEIRKILLSEGFSKIIMVHRAVLSL